MKRFLALALFASLSLPSAFAQSNDLVKYDKEVFKTFIQDKLKKEKSLNLDEAQLELLIYKLGDYYADYAKKLFFELTQQQISGLQDSTKVLPGLRKDVNRLNKELAEKQGDLDQSKAEVQNLKLQRDALQKTANQLREYRDLADQIDDMKNQLQASEEKNQADLKQVAEDHEKEIAALQEKHDQEVAGLNDQLRTTRDELSGQKKNAENLQAQIQGLNQELITKNEELAKWQGGIERVLTAIEGQFISAKSSSLAEIDPLAFESSVSSYNNLRDLVQGIDPNRVSSIDTQIKEVDRLMTVGKVFNEASAYIQGRQDVEKAKILVDQLKRVRRNSGLTKNQEEEIERVVTALDNQSALYNHLRTYLSQLRSKGCLPTKAKIEEQLGLIDELKETDNSLLMPDYHKSYVDAISKLKDNLQKAAYNDRVVAPIVKDDAKFPGMIDEIINML